MNKFARQHAHSIRFDRKRAQQEQQQQQKRTRDIKIRKQAN
jgi:hypothetical protein